jgi:hypothetical protein
MQLLTLHGVQLLRLQGVQLLRLHEETFLRNFYKKFSQEKRRFATRLPLGRRALAASGSQRTTVATSWPERVHAPGWHADYADGMAVALRRVRRAIRWGSLT